MDNTSGRLHIVIQDFYEVIHKDWSIFARSFHADIFTDQSLVAVLQVGAEVVGEYRLVAHVVVYHLIMRPVELSYFYYCLLPFNAQVMWLISPKMAETDISSHGTVPVVASIPNLPNIQKWYCGSYSTTSTSPIGPLIVYTNPYVFLCS